MRLLVVGGGGREHALCWALRGEQPDADLFCAPGNPGTAELATNLAIAADDLDRLADAADMSWFRAHPEALRRTSPLNEWTRRSSPQPSTPEDSPFGLRMYRQLPQ